jgi:hypothetical protein
MVPELISTSYINSGIEWIYIYIYIILYIYYIYSGYSDITIDRFICMYSDIYIHILISSIFFYWSFDPGTSGTALGCPGVPWLKTRQTTGDRALVGDLPNLFGIWERQRGVCRDAGNSREKMLGSGKNM